MARYPEVVCLVILLTLCGLCLSRSVARDPSVHFVQREVLPLQAKPSHTPGLVSRAAHRQRAHAFVSGRVASPSADFVLSTAATTGTWPRRPASAAVGSVWVGVVGALLAAWGVWYSARRGRREDAALVCPMALLAVQGKRVREPRKATPNTQPTASPSTPSGKRAEAPRAVPPRPPVTPGVWRVFNVEVAASQDPGKDDFSVHAGLRAALKKRIGVVPEEVTLVRKSFDARPTRKGLEPKFSYVVDVAIDAATAPHAILRAPMEPTPAHPTPSPPPPAPADMERVVIVGVGPAGLFAAYRFVEAGIGAKVVVVEQGQPVEQRGRDIGALFHRRVLDQTSNVCFGEGGAGTWSDGKLTTRIGRNAAEVRKVLEVLHAFGAPDQVLVAGKPHMGTDKLVRLLRNMRQYLEAGGVEFRFGSQVVDFEGGEGGRPVTGVVLRDGQVLPCGFCVLSTGHSSRGVYELLHAKGGPAALEAKGFAVGFRVEHPQALINRLRLGRWADSVENGSGPLPVADYRLACGEAEGAGGGDSYGDTPAKGVYSFCMCPGGQIVPTATDPSELCINGMSFSRRQSNWANAALVVTVGPADWERVCPPSVPKPLAGLWFQQQMERRAAEMGGGNLTVPVQRLVDFLARRDSDPATLPPSSYRLGVKAAPLHQLYPAHISDALARAVRTEFERSLPGFATSPEALLHGVETRTSSPVRVLRDPDTLQCCGIPGVFPAGEGAGYAGGIVSSAVDGGRVADAVLRAAAAVADGMETAPGNTTKGVVA